MKAELLPEPELQFGAGTHVDIRFGLKNYGPITFDDENMPDEIRLGNPPPSTAPIRPQGLAELAQLVGGFSKFAGARRDAARIRSIG